MHPPNCKTRRIFLKTTAAGAATALTAGPLRAAQANETIGVGFIGVGGRGRSHVATVGKLAKELNLKIVAVNDAYVPRMNQIAKKTGAKPHRKHQELLADKDVDVVCIASPDRLHLPQALDAIRAGKDVYCEKPLGHWSQFKEAKAFHDETLKLKRVVQVGTQATSSGVWNEVGELIRKGAIGKPNHVSAGYYRKGDWGERMPIPDKNAKPGSDLDWEAFLGDAPKAPFSVQRFFSWRLFLDYSGGPSTDLLPHVFTPFARMLNVGMPSLAVASGGIFKYPGHGREVPDLFNMCLDYPEKFSVVLVCTLANSHSTPSVIRGDEATLTFDTTTWTAGPKTVTIHPLGGRRSAGKATQIEMQSKNPGGTTEHWRDFIRCVRSREKPTSNITFGYNVHTALCMSMLAFTRQKAARFDPEKEEIVL